MFVPTCEARWERQVLVKGFRGSAGSRRCPKKPFSQILKRDSQHLENAVISYSASILCSVDFKHDVHKTGAF